MEESKRVLVVDDEADLIVRIRRLLSAAGHEVASAPAGISAKEEIVQAVDQAAEDRRKAYRRLQSLPGPT